LGKKQDTPAAKPAKPASLAKPSSKQIQPSLGADKAVGLALREARLATGKSQEQLTLEAGLDRTYVSLLERGLKSPTLRTLFKLAGILGVKPSRILGDAEGMLEK
jgi:DNA-binding XRE family transcriptional regulator